MTAYGGTLHGGIALWELNAPPRNPSPDTLGKSYGKWGSWCRWPSRSPFWEWEEWVPPELTTSTSCPCTTRWRVGAQRTTSSPPAHIQPDEDVGCLINTLAMGLWLGTPQINTFSSAMLCQVKQEVSFEQWYHEVQCVKDHYLESVVWETIAYILSKGQQWIWPDIWALPLVWPTFCKSWPLSFGTEVSFNVLMQNFYKVTHNNNEKVPSFATRLEGILNQIWLQCPGRITDWEVQQHLKDHLFHGIWKHIRDSICYLYSNPNTMYSQLMVAACKAETENEEAQDKVWARSAVMHWACSRSLWAGKSNGQADGCLDKSRAG